MELPKRNDANMPTFLRPAANAAIVIALAVAVTAIFTAQAFAAGGKPGNPTGLSATADSHEAVTLSWDAPSSGAAPSEYRIFRRNMDDSDSRLARIATSTTTSYTDDGVDAGTEYRYRVSAVANGKQGKRSGSVDVTVPYDPEAVPQRPASLDLSEDTAGEIVAAWTAPATGPDPTGYKLYRTHVAENTTTLLTTTGSDTLTYTDDTVAEETWYSYSVTAVNDAGEGPANGPDAIKSKNQTPGVPEEVPSLDVSEESAGQVVVSWTAASDGPAATGFKIYRSRLTPGGDYDQGEVLIGTAGSDATSYTDSTVAAEVSYEYSVRARNDSGHSGAWRRAMITTRSQSSE